MTPQPPFSSPRSSSQPINVDALEPIPTPHSNIRTSASQPPPSVSEVNHLVLEYMRSRGYHHSEQAFLHQLSSLSEQPIARAFGPADVDDDYRNMVLMLKGTSQNAVEDVKRYERAFSELCEWVDGSLDIYKQELHAVLYPLFVHCYLEMIRLEQTKEARLFLTRFSEDYVNTSNTSNATKQEILSLASISTPQHLEQNSTAMLFLTNRYELRLSTISYSLLVSFLHDDTRRHLLLRMLNQRCRSVFDKAADDMLRSCGFEDMQKQQSTREDGFVQATEREKLLENDLLWGRLRPEHYMIADDYDPKKKVKAPEKGGTDAKKADGAKKDAKDDGEDEATTCEDGTISASRIPLKKYRYGAPGIETAQDRRNRARLGRGESHELTKDLAALCYTFTNVGVDGINCSAISEDGCQVACGLGDSTVRIWDAKRSGHDEEGKYAKGIRLVGHSGGVYAVDWTKCGRYIISGSEDGTVRLWNVDYKSDIAVYQGHNYPVWSCQFSGLDHYFASASHDRSVRVWSTDRTYPLRIMGGHHADVDCVQWHPNCNYIASGSSDRTVRLWDLRDGKCARVFSVGGSVYSMAFSPDGKTLACGGDESCIAVWDIRMGKRLRKLQAHRSTVWCLKYSREGGLLVSGGADCRVCVWRASDWSEVVAEFQEEQSGKKDKDGDGDVKMSNGDEKGEKDKGDKEKGDKEKDKEEREKEKEKDKDKDKDKDKEEKDKVEKGKGGKKDGSSLVDCFRTKDTAVHAVQFTRRNVLVVAGSYAGS